MPPESPAPRPGPSVGASDPTLVLQVNGETREVPAPCSVEALLHRLAMDSRRIAVAVNREVVPRSAYARRALDAGDRVEILEAVGGG